MFKYYSCNLLFITPYLNKITRLMCNVDGMPTLHEVGGEQDVRNTTYKVQSLFLTKTKSGAIYSVI